MKATTKNPCPVFHVRLHDDTVSLGAKCSACGDSLGAHIYPPALTELNQEIHPWGTSQVLAVGPGYKVKMIEVNIGARLSLQSHAKREERWVVVRGLGRVTHGEDNFPVVVHDTVGIWRGVKHRMANEGGLPLVFMEVQLGAELSEDDSVRYEDDYGRAGK